jgi:SpoVK/Ycf46/Vps4 family AAA+-type ATPase
VVATCNDITQLPPELVRKGRFDEIFFVDLPAREVRKTIFELHLRRRGRDPGAFDLEQLAERTAGFSGAEIEQVVLSGLYDAFAHGDELRGAHLLGEIDRTVPLSRTAREKIEALRAFAKDRAVAAE